MKLFLYFFVFFLFFCLFSNNNQLSAGIGKETWGAGGIQHDIEVNEIEEIEAEVKKESQSKDIKSMELRNIDPGTIGILTDNEGLGYKMWEGSDRKFIEKYLKVLPVNKKSKIAVDLTKKLLLSSADVPHGLSKDNLAFIRIKKLIELGDLENAKLLIDSIEDNQKSEMLRKIEVEINLSLNNFDLVCLDIDEQIRNYNKDLYWKKIQIFCQILNEEINKANLGLSLIKEDNEFNDDVFINIVDSLIYKEDIDSSQFYNINLLNLAMSRVGKIALKDDLFINDDPLFMSMLYRMPNATVETRIKVLEKSQKLISVPKDIIEEIFNSYEVKENEIQLSLNDEVVNLGPATQAILYQSAIREDNDENKARILKQALERAIEKNNYPLIVNLNLETILEIKPSKKLLWFAHSASKALFYSNKLEEAFEWYKLLIKNKNQNLNLFIDFIEIWPIAEIYRFYERDFYNERKFDIDQKEIIKLINKFQLENEQLKFNTLGFYFLEVLGTKIDPNIWLATLEMSQENELMPNSSILSLLNFAAQNNRVGETVLLILIAADGNELKKLNPFFLQKIIKSLDRIGLGTKAKDFMIETLVF